MTENNAVMAICRSHPEAVIKELQQSIQAQELARQYLKVKGPPQTD